MADLLYQSIYLADDEHGNALMHRIARDYWQAHIDRLTAQYGESVVHATQNATLVAAVVNVYEHAGWYLTWYFDFSYPAGIIIGTANDMAASTEEKCAVIRERIKPHKMPYTQAIRRGAAEQATA